MIDPTGAPGRFPLVPAIVLVGIAVLAIVAWQRVNRPRRNIVAATLAAAAIAFIAVGQIEPLEATGLQYAGPPSDASPANDAGVIGLHPHQVFPVALTVTNAGPLPVTLQGLDAGPTARNTPHYVQLHLLRDQTVLTPEDPDALVDFAPRTLAPGESLMLVATVDPGPCVMPNPPDAGGGFSLTEMPIAYDVLGWPRTFHAPFWNPVELAAASSCPG